MLWHDFIVTYPHLKEAIHLKDGKEVGGKGTMNDQKGDFYLGNQFYEITEISLQDEKRKISPSFTPTWETNESREYFVSVTHPENIAISPQEIQGRINKKWDKKKKSFKK